MVRHKNRYIVTLIKENDRDASKHLELKPASLFAAITTKVKQLYGDYGVAAIRAGFTAKYCNKRTKIAIVKVRHGPHKFVISALPCISTVEDRQIVLQVLHIGATIRQCFNFLVTYQQKRFDAVSASIKSDEERNALREAMLDIDDVLNIV